MSASELPIEEKEKWVRRKAWIYFFRLHWLFGIKKQNRIVETGKRKIEIQEWT